MRRGVISRLTSHVSRFTFHVSRFTIKNHNLKKLLPLLLFSTFLLFQGGRVIMYLECRFSNTITTPNCDCVQILADAKPGVDAIPAAGHANHKHLPEEFELLTVNLHHNIAPFNIANAPMHTGAIAQGIPADIFHPPIL